MSHSIRKNSSFGTGPLVHLVIYKCKVLLLLNKKLSEKIKDKAEIGTRIIKAVPHLIKDLTTSLGILETRV